MRISSERQEAVDDGASHFRKQIDPIGNFRKEKEMRAWAVVKPGHPLECVEVATPEPRGEEVLLEVTHCGVCHSDLHFQKGSYNLGGGRTMSIFDRGVTLPRAPGHEVVGRVVGVGPDARGIAVGQKAIVYPWIGCGQCERCRAEEDNLCTAQRSVGVMVDGGFASHVVVPHPRYLFDYGNVDPGLAATFACSGITTYSAVRKLLPLKPDEPVLLMGAGGLGFAAIAMLRALGHINIISVDISKAKRDAALAHGATQVVDGSAENVAQRVLDVANGPVAGAIDFVNSSSTALTAFECLRKGGRLVLIGVAGGELSLSLATMVFRAASVMGSYTGTLQDLREVVDLAKAGRLAPIPVAVMSKDEANEALALLRRGEVTGRIILASS
jgi:alcohol dehydrogenase, propanol-preferring